MREKVGKSRNTFFPMICDSGGSKSRLPKAAGAEPSGQMRDEKLHAVVARSAFASEKAKITSRSEHFWNEKVHAVVARSTFRSQNVQNTPCSDHFWKMRCRKSARRCGAKHISKSKCTKHTSSGPLLEVEMSKKCTPLWREAHFEVKMLKTPGVRTTLRCRFAWQAKGVVHLLKSEQNVRVLLHFPKRWQAWDICGGSAKMHFAWQTQYKRHVHQRC